MSETIFLSINHGYRMVTSGILAHAFGHSFGLFRYFLYNVFPLDELKLFVTISLIGKNLCSTNAAACSALEH